MKLLVQILDNVKVGFLTYDKIIFASISIATYLP